MTGQTDSRAKEIKRRARKYRRKRENRSLLTLASLAVILMTGIIALIAGTGGGTVSTDGGYGRRRGFHGGDGADARVRAAVRNGKGTEQENDNG